MVKFRKVVTPHPLRGPRRQHGKLGGALDEVDWGFVMHILAHHKWKKLDIR